MLADTADSHKLPGKVDEHESKAKAYFAHERKQKRLAKNRVTAKRSRYVVCAFVSAIWFCRQQLWEALISINMEPVCMQRKKTSISAATTAEITFS